MTSRLLAAGLACCLLSGCGPPPLPPSPNSGSSSQDMAFNQVPKGPSGVPIFHQVPDFHLVGDDGAPLTRASLKDKVWIASFIFTSCGDTCPAMVTKIQTLQHTIPEGALLVSVSVDPERDTPAKLKEYADFNHRRAGKWLLATGQWDAISELAMKGFYLGGGKRQLHSPRFGLVDKAARLRGYYDSRDPEQMTKLVRDLNLLLSEPVPEAPAEPAPAGPPSE